MTTNISYKKKETIQSLFFLYDIYIIMKRLIRLTETDLTKIINRVISENHQYNPDQLYTIDNMIERIKRGPKFIHKYIKTLPHLKKEGSDKVYTKIPQVVWQNI